MAAPTRPRRALAACPQAEPADAPTPRWARRGTARNPPLGVRLLRAAGGAVEAVRGRRRWRRGWRGRGSSRGSDGAGIGGGGAGIGGDGAGVSPRCSQGGVAPCEGRRRAAVGAVPVRGTRGQSRSVSRPHRPRRRGSKKGKMRKKREFWTFPIHLENPR
ncbi:uncharacterized protein LOC143694552 [Agelaius phoeniceus]|uniref:uncharacterized protein LOC143694552 n=1 Tax=Agelaius phoeniceus TaxID=39638 RepID=UPI0040550043